MFIAYILAALIGVSLGLLGAGGSILAVPILRHAAGFSVAESVAGALLVVGSVSAVGAALAYRDGRVFLLPGIGFAFLASLGTMAGVQLGLLVGETVQMALFLLVMTWAIWGMSRSDPPAAGPPKEASPPSQTRRLGALFKAISVGVVTGLVGVGGGFLIVPALIALYGLDARKATGTSLLVIAFNSAVGLLGYSRALELNWPYLASFTGAALAGLALGLSAAQKIENRTLSRLFTGLLLLVLVGTLVAEISAL